MSTSGQERKQLQDALLNAFPEKSSLEQMLMNKLNQNLDEIAGGNNLQDIVYNLIKKTDAQGWVRVLIFAAYDFNPGNSSLNNLVKEMIGSSLGNTSFDESRKEKYKITEADLVDSGVYAKVYSTKNDLGKDIILKKLQKTNIRKQFKSAITKAFEISNLPNFITIYDSDIYIEEPYYVMQFINGDSLRKYFDPNLKLDNLDNKKKIEIILKIGDAMINAMKNPEQPPYLNIKPSNIMIDYNKEPYISAFNLFVNLGQEELIEELEELFDKDKERLKEQLAYLLPDQFNKGVNEKSNQYMLGLLAYELITNKIPPSIKNIDNINKWKKGELRSMISEGQLFQQISFDNDWNIKAEYPDEIKEIILQMTDLDPTKRFKDLKKALEIIDIYSRLKDVREIIISVKKSYIQCIHNRNPPSFFEKFYEKFIIVDGVAELFKNIKQDKKSWENHHKAVERSILLLIWYYEEKNIFAPIKIQEDENLNFLDSIAKPHIRLSIPENLLEYWFICFKKTLIETIIEYDPKCKNEEQYKNSIQLRWEEVLKPGFEYIKEYLTKHRMQ